MQRHGRLLGVELAAGLFALGAGLSPPARAQPPRAAEAVEPLAEDQRAIVDRFGAPFLGKLTTQGISAKNFLYADRLARVGLRNLAQEEYGDAMYLFQKAHGLIKSPHLLLYMAQTYERLGEFLQVREFLRRFTDEAPSWTLTEIDAAKVEAARRKIEKLEQRLVTLQLDVHPAGTGIFVNGEAVGKSPRAQRIWLMPGSNRVVLAKKGHARHEILLNETRPGARVFRTVRLLTREEEIRANELYRAQVRKKQRLQARIKAEQARANRVRRKRARVFRLAGWCVAGAGVAALITGGVFGLLADQQAEDVRSAQAGTAWTAVQDEYGRAEDYRTAMVASVISGAGLVAIGAGLVFYGYWTTRHGPERTKSSRVARSSRAIYVAPSMTPNRIGLMLGVEL